MCDFLTTKTETERLYHPVAPLLCHLEVIAKKSGISKSQLSDIILGNKIPNVYTLYLICTALSISLSDFFDFEDTVIMLRGKEALLVKIYRELSPMSQDTLIKAAKCMK